MMEVYCWTNSMTVLQWIRNKDVYRQYMQSRINEIRQRTNGYCWQHCPGNVNPTDLPSGGMSAKQLVNSRLWWNGPEFLQLPAKEWPRAQVDGIGTEARAELVKHPPIITHSMLSLGVEGHSLLKISEAMKADKYSSYHLLLRVSAYVICFVDRVTASTRKSSQLTVTATEILDAEMMWIRSIQYTSFLEVVGYLDGLIHKKPLLVDQFGLYLDENHVLRCKRRLGNSTLPSETKRDLFFYLWKERL